MLYWIISSKDILVYGGHFFPPSTASGPPPFTQGRLAVRQAVALYSREAGLGMTGIKKDLPFWKVKVLDLIYQSLISPPASPTPLSSLAVPGVLPIA